MMILYWMIVLFLFGLAIGSFVNVVVYRTMYGESPLKGRSRCPKCKKQISWKHNIPLLSYVLLGGKCSDCKTSISWQYPMVELLFGVLFVWWGLGARAFFLLVATPLLYVQPVFWLGVGVLLLLVFVFDAWYGVIPNGVNLLLFGWVLLYRLLLVKSGVMQVNDFWTSLVAGLGLALFFYGLYIFTRKKGFGLGDVKLAPSLGLIMGARSMVVGVMSSFMMGAMVAVVLLVIGKKKFGQTIALGPFLVVGTLVGLMWGGAIWDWYMGMLL